MLTLRAKSWVRLTVVVHFLFGCGTGGRDLYAQTNLRSSGIKTTGSPLDKNQNCNSCHSAKTINSNSTGITLTVPTQWASGTSYNLTLTVTKGTAGAGFEITAENASAKQGTFIAGTGSGLAVSGSSAYLGQTSPSTSGSWTFQWTAPTDTAGTTGTITFYVIGLRAVSYGSSSEILDLKSFAVPEAAPVAAPTITVQPSPQTVPDGASASFSIAATGQGTLSYQWQMAPSGSSTFSNVTSGTGGTTAVYTTGAVALANSGNQYRCLATNSGGTTTSNAATLTVTPIAPTLTSQPSAATVNDGQTANFTVTASGSLPLTYQWQRAPSGSTAFTNVSGGSGATSATYTTPALTPADNGFSYRCVVDNAANQPATSNAALLTVNAVAPSISAQPSPQTVIVGQTATFMISATGSSPLAYQWQSAPPGSSSFTNVATGTGGTTNSYTTAATALSDDGTTYRCIVSNGVIPAATSSSVLLSVTAQAIPPSIATPPASQSVNDGSPVTFTVSASGTAPLSYQWQKAPPGSSVFSAISGAPNAATYSLLAVTLADSGSRYQVVVNNVTNQPSTSTPPALLTVNAVAPSISVQPSPQTIAAGQTATFAVSATGSSPLSYQWQKAPAGSVTYSNVSGGTGATSASYTTPATSPSDNNAMYRVIVNNATNQPATSAAVLLTVNSSPPSITSSPSSQTIQSGQTASFSVTASGTLPLTYQWQVAAPGSATFSNVTSGTGGTSSSYTTAAMGLSDSGSTYRVIVNNSSNQPATSAAATLTVTASPSAALTIVQQPLNARVPVGQSASFTIGVSDPNDPTLSYQWYRDGQPITLNGVDAVYTIPVVTAADSGAHFYCLVANAVGSITSDQVQLLVATPLVAPQLANAAPYMSLADVLVIANSYSVPVTFNWTFSYIAPATGTLSAGGAASFAGASASSAQAATPTGALALSSLHLAQGQYLVSVGAVSAFGDASPVTTANITFLSGNFDHVQVYPNPWRLDRHASTPYVEFNNLTPNTTVKIFTVSGRLARSLSGTGGNVQWDLKNDSGESVSSGIYLYLLTDSAGNKKRGKLAIIR